MNKLFRLLFLSLISLSQVASAYKDTDKNKDSLKVAFSDDPMVAYFDSVLLANYASTEELFDLDLLSDPTTIPEFSDIEFFI